MTFDYKTTVEPVAAVAVEHADAVDRGAFPQAAMRALG